MPEMKPIALSGFWRIPIVGIPLAFLLLYSDNLHCDQYATFLGAALGGRHPEEGLAPQVFPLIYKDWVGLPIRLLATASVFLSVMGSFIMLRMQRQRRCGFWPAVAVSLALALLPGIGSWLFGQPVLGERFEALGYPASTVGLAVSWIAVIPSIFVRARRRREGAD
jgi:hypothetical protein